MANQILTHQMIAREAAKMLEEEAPFLANINKGRQDEFGTDTQGYKKAIPSLSKSQPRVKCLMALCSQVAAQALTW